MMEVELQQIEFPTVKDHETAATGVDLNGVAIVQDVERDRSPEGLYLLEARRRTVTQINRRLLAPG